MSRPVDITLDGWVWNRTSMSSDIRFIELVRNKGAIGLVVYIGLRDMIAANGYYAVLNDTFIFALYSHLMAMYKKPMKSLREMIEYFVRVDLFDKALYEENILSSVDIQQSWYRAKKHSRTRIPDTLEYWLLSDLLPSKNENNCSNNADKCSNNGDKCSNNEGYCNLDKTKQNNTKEKNTEQSKEAATKVEYCNIPTLDEVKAYCKERGGKINPDRFYNYYSSIQWQIKGSRINDWKALARSWEATERQIVPNNRQTASHPQSMIDKMEAMYDRYKRKYQLFTSLQ